MAVDGKQGVLGSLPRAGEIARGGGNEVLGRVHGRKPVLLMTMRSVLMWRQALQKLGHPVCFQHEAEPL